MTEPISPVLLDHCQNLVTCPDGNCPGCNDGNLWCDDSRCHPHCEDCPETNSQGLATSTVVIIIIVVFILVMLIGLWAYRGYQEPGEIPGFVPDHMKYNNCPQVGTKIYRHTGFQEVPVAVS